MPMLVAAAQLLQALARFERHERGGDAEKERGGF
jgi:hypothetical protein